MGWLTADNASPNDTQAETLQVQLHKRKIAFDALERHIRSDYRLSNDLV